jgi:hypothetical protein
MEREKRLGRQMGPFCAATVEPLEDRRLLSDSSWVYPSTDGSDLLYRPTEMGDRIIDYANVGYRDGRVPLPEVPVKVVVRPGKGDDWGRIQGAIDEVSALPVDPETGFRGAVLIERGIYRVHGTLTIDTSGVVLRGEGDGRKGTRLVASAADRRPLIDVNYEGRVDVPARGAGRNVTDKYIPAGARTFHLDDVSGLGVGDRIVVSRPSTQEWIERIGMDLLEFPWVPGTHKIEVERRITRLEGNKVTIDDPLTHSLDQRYGGGTVYGTRLVNRIRNVGIEDLRGDSTYASETDVEHAWSMVRFHATEDAWVRRVTAEHFVQGAVTVKFGGRSITVQDAVSRDPVSPVLGGMRYAFYVDDGEKVLFRDLVSVEGRHDFVAGSLTHGPNVWVDGVGRRSHTDTGPHEDYSTGMLFDNLSTNDEINIRNRGNAGTNHGWTGANSVVWNSTAERGFRVRNPPGSQNWLIGGSGANKRKATPPSEVPLPNDQGIYDSVGKMVTPRSLYYAQLEARDRYPRAERREYWVGDVDGYLDDGAGDDPYVSPKWSFAVGGKGGVRSFDSEGDGPIAFTINFGLSPGERVVGASLSVGLRRTGAPDAGGRLLVGSEADSRTLKVLGWRDLSTSPDARVLDLGDSLERLQGGRLNVGVRGALAVDWAVLNVRVVPAKGAAKVVAEDGKRAARADGDGGAVFGDVVIASRDDDDDMVIRRKRGARVVVY